jgi:hypothetical protein
MPNTEKSGEDTERELSENEARLKELGKRIDKAEAEIKPAKPEGDDAWKGDVA